MQKFDLRKDEALLKTAALENPGLLRQMVAPLALAAGVTGSAGLYGYFQGKERNKKHEEDLARSLGEVLKTDPTIKAKPAQAASLFGELSVMAPTVAKNPLLATRLIRERMDKGFDLDDVHKLSVIEHSGGISRSLPTPRAAAGAAAASALGQVAALIGPDEWRKLRDANAAHRDYVKSIQEEEKLLNEYDGESAQREWLDRVHAAAAKSAPKKSKWSFKFWDRDSGHEKKSSAEPYPLLVSEACLGQMLSDRVTMIKEAGMREDFVRGAGKLKSHLTEHIMPALVLGGGIGLAKLVYDKAKDREIIRQGDENFAKLMRTSDALKGNPEVAREAYETLKLVAPVLATRPGVLKEFVERQASTGTMPNYEQVRALAEAGQAVDRSSAGSNKGFLSGVKDILNVTGLPLKKDKDDEGGGSGGGIFQRRQRRGQGQGSSSESDWDSLMNAPKK